MLNKTAINVRIIKYLSTVYCLYNNNVFFHFDKDTELGAGLVAGLGVDVGAGGRQPEVEGRLLI